MGTIRVNINYYGFEEITGFVNNREQAEKFINAFEGVALPDFAWNNAADTGHDFFYSGEVLISITFTNFKK